MFRFVPISGLVFALSACGEDAPQISPQLKEQYDRQQIVVLRDAAAEMLEAYPQVVFRIENVGANFVRVRVRDGFTGKHKLVANSFCASLDTDRMVSGSVRVKVWDERKEQQYATTYCYSTSPTWKDQLDNTEIMG